MNKKPFIIIGVVLLLVLGVAVVCVIGAIFYHRSAGKTRYLAGREFGKTTDQAGCRDESLRQIREYRPDTFTERYKKTLAGNFTKGCLQTCKATNEFCYSVPRLSDGLADYLEWLGRQCESGEAGCTGVFSTIAKECGKIPLEEVSYPE